MLGRAAIAAVAAAVAGVAVPESAAAVVPNDPLFPSQYGLRLVDAPTAWDLQTGAPSVLVASIDDGVDPALGDLAVNLVPGMDFGNADGDPTQAESDHGSQTASLLAARGNNAVGMAGVAWSIGLMPLKVRTDGPGERFDLIAPSAVAEAFRHAGARGARVANASFGLRAGTTQAEQAAIAAAIAASPNTLFVVSAGNTGRDNDAAPRYPCSFDAPNLLCVAATDAGDALWPSSSYGATSVDLAAPGAGVYVKTNRTDGPVDGTSYAAPLVSGAAALYFSRHPAATVADARNAILAGVDPKPSLSGRTVSGGRLNIARTLTIPPAGAAPPAGPVPGTSPPATPTQPSAAPTWSLRVAARQRLSDTLRRGLRVSVVSSSRQRFRLVLRLSSTRARRLGIARVAGAATVTVKPGVRHLRVALGRTARRRLARERRVALELSVTAGTTAGGAPRTIRRSVVLTRGSTAPRQRAG